jgi:hypothetical protein
MLKRIGTVIGLFVLCAWSILRVARPPAPVAATAPDTVFSAERAMRHVEAIAQRPHALGMPDHDQVRDYIIAQLAAMGLRSQVQQVTGIGTRYQEAGRVQNVLAWLPGSDPKGKGLLLVAHYDGVGAGPAAADDGAGCAALLETLRALRARKTPLAHDLFVLFSDGEESGLLGAAAFVREHPWTKDVSMVLNFEARGTGGRSFMFETGPGNLDAARVLRAAGGATAASVYTTIYRTLPNDTDLSEFAVLGVPAMNFAFTDGVELYHTSGDDLAHLSPGSVQHHGSQMLALVKLIGNGPLPRPVTGDGVFFDLPFLGLVVYPEGWSIPLAVLATLLVVMLVARDRSGVAAGVVTTMIGAVAAGIIGEIGGALVSGPGVWSGAYAGSVALFALAATLGCQRLAMRWSSPRGVHVGAMIVWAILALVTSVKIPGASYLFIWPLLFAAAVALRSRGRAVAEWVAAAITLLMLAGLVYGVSVLLLGVAGPGAIVAAVLTSLIAALLVPQLETIVADAPRLSVAWPAGAGVAFAIVGVATVRSTADHPVRSALVYTENADSSDAWLGSMAPLHDAWQRSAIGAVGRAPAWASRLAEEGNRFAGRAVVRVALEAPSAVLVRDALINGARRVVFRVTAPPGTTTLVLRATGAPVLSASIDGRVVDTTRYRRKLQEWAMAYSAPPDSGAIVALSIPAAAHIGLELAAWRPGIPSVPGLSIPKRPANVVPSQAGDVSVVFRVLKF